MADLQEQIKDLQEAEAYGKVEGAVRTAFTESSPAAEEVLLKLIMELVPITLVANVATAIEKVRKPKFSHTKENAITVATRQIKEALVEAIIKKIPDRQRQQIARELDALARLKNSKHRSKTCF